MITKDKLIIFQKYRGDVDQFGIFGKKSERRLIKDDDWFLISNLLQDIKLINDNLASSEYITNVFKTINDVCDGEQTSLLLKDLAQTL